MKVFLILWALGLSACDKLDRTYLPPPSSKTAGGQSENLDLPLEFPKENYPTTLEPRVDDIHEINSLRPNYSNIALGISRQGPFVTSSGSGLPFSENAYNEPSSTSSYASQTTTSVPAEYYKTTVGSARNQDYPSTSLSFNPNLNDPKFLTSQNVDRDHGYSKNFGSNNLVYESQGTNNGPFLRYSNGSSGFPISNVQENSESGFLSGSRFPEYQLTKYGRPVSSNLSPQDFINSNYPSNQYRVHLNTKPRVTVSTPTSSYPDYNDENNSAIYKIQQSPETYKEILKSSTPQIFKVKDTDFYGPTKTIDSAKFAPNRYTTSSTVLTPTESKSTEYSSFPTMSLKAKSESYYSPANRLERVQAENDRNAVIVNYKNLLTSDGFAYSFDTSNGIHVDESGTATDGVRAQGSYSYIGDDGKMYSVTYTADENGFLPRGDHLPTAPPIPNAILKVIEQAAKDKQMGINDDGSYDDLKYGHGRYQGFAGRKPQDHKYMLGKRPENASHGKHVPANDRDSLHQTDIGNKITVSSERPYDNVGNIDEETKKFVPFNKYDENSSIYPTNGVLGNKKLIGSPADELTGSSKSFYKPPTSQDQYYGNNYPNTGIKSTSVIEEYRESQPSHEGYKYDPPHSEFQRKEVNAFQPFLQNFNEDGIKIPSESFNGNTQDLPPNKQLIAQNFNYPMSGGDGDRRHDYFSSTSRPQFPSTTSLPSQFSFQSTLSTNDGRYSDTTPTSDLFISTLRPSISSETTGLISRTPAYTIDSESGQGPVTAIGTSTARPSYVNKINGRLGNRGRPIVTLTNNDSKKFGQRIPQRNNVMIPRFDVSDPRTQNLRTSTRPKNFGIQSTTEKVIGEDFSGPQQAPTFDPEHGYYY